MPTTRPFKRAKPQVIDMAQCAMDLHVVTVVDHSRNDLLHVIGLVGRLGHQVDQFGRFTLRVVAGENDWRLVQIVGG